MLPKCIAVAAAAVMSLYLCGAPAALAQSKALNPQPIPPGKAKNSAKSGKMLNPQPIPPGKPGAKQKKTTKKKKKSP